MTNIEKIRKSCIAANGEIVDLKFGSRVGLFGSSYIFVEHLENGFYTGEGQCYLYPTFGLGKEGVLIKTDVKNLKIIGRPIRLADVLYMTVNYSNKDWDWRDKAKETVLDGWNLLRDDLNDQTEETREFIANLLP